jgi:hypothetical protein
MSFRFLPARRHTLLALSLAIAGLGAAHAQQRVIRIVVP